MDVQQRIAEIEKEIREMPYHKGTEHHIGLLRARLSRLQDQVLEGQSKGGGGGRGFAVRRAGDATVVLVGPPSVGKSTLLNALTNAKSPVAPYAFTTVSVIPGMMNYCGAMIQIMDVPGLVAGAARGRGRGQEVLSVIRGADLLVIVTELGKEEWFNRIKDELSIAGVRIGGVRPQIHIVKKTRGGILIRGASQSIPENMLRQIFHEFGLKNAEILTGQKLTVEEIIDALSFNRVFVPAIFVVNKVDLKPYVPIEIHLGGGLGRAPREKVVLVSGKTGKGLEELRKAIWNSLGLVRIYLSKLGKEPDYESPIVMRREQTLKDVAGKVGQAVTYATHARISGPGSKFKNQQASLSVPVVDEMVVTFEG